MNAAEKLEPIQVKIDRAKEHIIELDSAIRGFLDSKPYPFNTKRDANRRLIYYVSSMKPIPKHFATITGDAIQNLRSALDHLTWQLFLVGPQGTTTNRQVQRQVSFPIGCDAAGFASQLGTLRGIMRQDAITTLNGIQPYNGGKGHKLWVLHELNIIDKHRLFVTFGSFLKSANLGAYMCAQMNVTGFPVPKVDAYFRTTDKLFPLKVGTELFIDTIDAQENKWLDFRFNITLNEPGVIDGEDLLETLNNFSDLVSKTVSLFTPCLT
jgi:hypothetical protein